MNEANGRHELKHYINYADFLQLRARLPCVAQPDKNATGSGSYRVRSLYFDNFEDKALMEKINGISQREKFRLRLYNDNAAFIRLEKKSKNRGMCIKESSIITETECRQLLGGDIEVLKTSGDRLLLELYTKMHYQQLRPKSIVDYKRDAFVYAPGNVRITMDYDIRATGAVHTFLDRELLTVPVPDTIILEVKYDAFLPEIIRGLVSLSSRQSTAFSKYATARMV